MMEKSKDLISRADAIEGVMNIEPTFDTRSLEPYQKEKDVVSAIESLPSASVETEMSLPKWIPVSERLPDDGQKILVCYADGKRIATKYSPRHLASWVAWMPLPKPYREDGE